MKQHITVEQLEELSKIKQEILYKWWSKGFVKMGCGRFVYLGRESKPYETKDILPLLSIGQMIEFLHDKNTMTLIGTIDEWHEQYVVDKNKEELCDWLWEAVKEVLK